MGKGDENAKIETDTNGTGTTHRVVLSLHDDITSGQVTTLAGKPNQGAFDDQAEVYWDWYERQPTTYKSRLRASILNRA